MASTPSSLRTGFLFISHDGKSWQSPNKEIQLVETAVERIRKLDTERNALLGNAKKDALARAQQAVTDLVALGFEYTLINGGTPQNRQKKVSRPGAGAIKDAPCPICEFRTNPPHDARAHRSQKRKRAFSVKDIKERGYEKVA